MIFRLSEHVPDVYVKESRDFQLLCNVADVLFGSLKFNIDAIRYVVDTPNCDELLLPLLQTKLGFFTDKTYSAKDTRLILSAFKFLIRNKGSILGIIQAVYLFLRSEGVTATCQVAIGDSEDKHVIHIKIDKLFSNFDMLTDILRYIIPTGYFIKFEYFPDNDIRTTLRNNNSVIYAYPTYTAELQTDEEGNETLVKTIDSYMNSSIRIVTANDYSKLLSKVNTATIMPQDRVTVNDPTENIDIHGRLL